MLSRDNLLAIFPFAKARVDVFLDPLNAAMLEFGIDTPIRQASFLAQVGHESGQLRYVRELASGEAYEKRADLGNTLPGDGVRYKGRGLIQITGKRNYLACGLALDLPLLDKPELLEDPVNACRSAAWFWYCRNLNQLADRNDQRGICRLVNGRYNGLEDRLALFEKAWQVLGG